MQPGDFNASATILRAMNEIFRPMILKDPIIYIDDIIIPRTTYKKHVETPRKVLQRLQDQQFCLKESKCQFFTKRLAILVHILTPEALLEDPQKVRKICNFPTPQDNK